MFVKKSSRIRLPTRCFSDTASDLDFGVRDIDEELDIEEFVFEDLILFILIVRFK